MALESGDDEDEKRRRRGSSLLLHCLDFRSLALVFWSLTLLLLLASKAFPLVDPLE